MKIALVYDRANKWGGAERIMLALHELFPDAPLYTSICDPKSAPWTRIFVRIHTSFLDRFPLIKKRHDLVPFLMPLAFEAHNFSDYDLVISVTSEAAKGIITQPQTFHLCYLLTPTRYLWSGYDEYFSNTLMKLASKPLVSYLRCWDLMAASRPDEIVSISQEVAKRTKEYYRRDSKVIYPPVDVERFSQKTANWRVRARLEKSGVGWGEYYVVVSRLVPYKRVDVAVNAFRQLKQKLVVVGSGSEQTKLKKKAGKNIFFTGAVTEQDLPLYYQGAKALIFPQNEDFGIVSVEAQAAGKPVIALRRGGALETVAEGVTGVFFDSQTSESLVRALEEFDPSLYSPKVCRENAQRFAKEKFLSSFATLARDLVVK